MPFKGSFGAKPSKSFRSVLRVFNSFSDNFDRGNDFSGTVGLSSSRGLWKILRGSWSVFDNAVRPSLWNNYSIMAVDVTSPNATLSTSIKEGGQVVGANGTVSGLGAGDGTTGTVGFFWATLSGINSTTGWSVGDWISATDGTGRVYGGTPDLVEITNIVDANTVTFRVKTGSNGIPPSSGSVSNIIWKPNQRGGTGLAVWTTDSNNWIGIVNGVGTSSCNCSLCGNGTYSCTGYTSSTSCSSTSQYCSAGGCNRYSSYTYANYGQAVTGYYRVFSYTRVSYCSGWSSGSCSYSCASWSSSTSCSTNVQNLGSCNCQTCYPSYISVIKSTAGAVSELTRYSLTAAVKAIKVITNATTKTFTIKPYQDQEMTTQLGSDISYNNNSLTATNKFGIVLAISDEKQASEFNDFKIDTN